MNTTAVAIHRIQDGLAEHKSVRRFIDAERIANMRRAPDDVILADVQLCAALKLADVIEALGLGIVHIYGGTVRATYSPLNIVLYMTAVGRGSNAWGCAHPDGTSELNVKDATTNSQAINQLLPKVAPFND